MLSANVQSNDRFLLEKITIVCDSVVAFKVKKNLEL